MSAVNLFSQQSEPLGHTDPTQVHANRAMDNYMTEMKDGTFKPFEEEATPTSSPGYGF